jgi:hypothetical protein
MLFPHGATFGSGWSYEESEGERQYRWMAERADVRLPPRRRWSTMRLFLEINVPLHVLLRPPRIRVLLDGRELASFDGVQVEEQRAFLVHPSELRAGVEPELVLETSETVVLPPRKLGIALMRASWEPVGGAE